MKWVLVAVAVAAIVLGARAATTLEPDCFTVSVSCPAGTPLTMCRRISDAATAAARVALVAEYNGGQP